MVEVLSNLRLLCLKLTGPIFKLTGPIFQALDMGSCLGVLLLKLNNPRFQSPVLGSFLGILNLQQARAPKVRKESLKEEQIVS